VLISGDFSGPAYDINAPAAWDFLQAGRVAREVVRGARVVVGGNLAQWHPMGRRAWCELASLGRKCGWVALIDLNLRRPFFKMKSWCFGVSSKRMC